MIASLGELGDQPRVDSAGRRVFGSVDVLERPSKFGGREVRIEHESGDLSDACLMASLAQPRALVGRAAILPDDCGCDRLQSPAVPEHQRLALVGDAYRSHVAWFCVGSFEGAPCARLHGGPDLVGIVLDPTRTRVPLGDLLVALALNLTVQTNSDCGRAGRALVEA